MGRAGNSEGSAPEKPRGGLPLLQFAAFFSSFDRFVVAPMLVTIAAALGASLASVAATASLYYLMYGVMQPVRRRLPGQSVGVKVRPEDREVPGMDGSVTIRPGRRGLASRAFGVRYLPGEPIE